RLEVSIRRASARKGSRPRPRSGYPSPVSVYQWLGKHHGITPNPSSWRGTCPGRPTSRPVDGGGRNRRQSWPVTSPIDGEGFLPPGWVLGRRYRLERRIGAVSEGAVYAAHNQDTARRLKS